MNFNLKIFLSCLILLAGILPCNASGIDIPGELDRYNVVWDSPSLNQDGSMPLGNGDIGMNVWAEMNGDLLFYISKTDSWSENSRLLKLGRVRVHFSSNPFAEGLSFSQILNLRNGEVLINCGKGGKDLKLKVWIDANNPVIHIEADSRNAIDLTVSLELWRTEESILTDWSRSEVGDMFRLIRRKGWEKRHIGPNPYPTISYPDKVVANDDDRIIWYHHNQKPPYDPYEINMNLQSLGGYMDKIEHPLENRIFGAIMEGDGLVSVDDVNLKTEKPVKRAKIALYVLTRHPSNPEKWRAGVEKIIDKIAMEDIEGQRLNHYEWWDRFWGRSYVFASGDKAYEVTRAYILQRFKNACAGRGTYPLKFNGSLFSVGKGKDPDFMRWGSPGYWFQNQRLIYWPMLASGDYDLMEPWFRLYRNILPMQRMRTQVYFNHAGAHFPETVTFWGSEVSGHYGWTPLHDRGSILAECPFVTYYWQNGIEQTLMMLDYYLFTGDESFAKETLVPMAEAIVDFYYRHYDRVDGKIHFSPAQALETYHQASNPMPVVAGLNYTVNKLLSLPDHLLNHYQTAIFTRILEDLPEIPLETEPVSGEDILAPAYTYSKPYSKENAELYAVFPYRIYGVNKPDLDLAERSFHSRKVSFNYCWSQEMLQMACLGLADSAKTYLIDRLSFVDEGIRFPAFWSGAMDWIPDEDHGGNIVNALQTMLLQSEATRNDKSILLFPAWPEEWDVSFKLHAPYNTVIEGVLENGKLKELKVTPESRRKDLIIMDAQ